MFLKDFIWGLRQLLGNDYSQDVPDVFRKRYSRALLRVQEAAGELLVLHKDIGNFLKQMTEKAENEKKGFDFSCPLDQENLQNLLYFYFPDKEMDFQDNHKLFKELIELGLDMPMIGESYHKVKPYLPEIEKDLFGVREELEKSLSQAGAMRAILYLTRNSYFEKSFLPDGVKDIFNKWKNVIAVSSEQ